MECDNWIKNTLEEIDRRLDDMEEWNSDPELRVVEIIQAEQKKKEFFKNEGHLRDLWDNIKHHGRFRHTHKFKVKK